MIVERSLQNAGWVQVKQSDCHQRLPHSFFLDHFYTYYSPCFLRTILLLHQKIEDLSDHFFSRFVACLDVFSSDSIVISCFTFSGATCGSLKLHVVWTLIFSFFTSSLQPSLSVFIVVSKFLRVLSAAENAQHSRKSGSRRDIPSLPACTSPTRNSLTPGCDDGVPLQLPQQVSCFTCVLCTLWWVLWSFVPSALASSSLQPLLLPSLSVCVVCSTMKITYFSLSYLTCCLVCFNAAAYAFAFTFCIFIFLPPPSLFALLLLLLSISFDFISFSSSCFAYTLISHRQRDGTVVCLRLLLSLFQYSSMSIQHRVEDGLREVAETMWVPDASKPFISHGQHLLSLLRTHIGTSPSMCTRLCLLPQFPFIISSICSSLLYVSSLPRAIIPYNRRLIPTIRLLRVVSSNFSSTSTSIPWYLWYWRRPFAHLMITICPSTDTCLVLLHLILFWWKLSAPSMAGDTLIFRPMDSFFSMFADLTNLSLSSLSVNCKKASGTFDLDLIRWHSYRSYYFIQLVVYFLFCRVVMESCHLYFSWLGLICLFNESWCVCSCGEIIVHRARAWSGNFVLLCVFFFALSVVSRNSRNTVFGQ